MKRIDKAKYAHGLKGMTSGRKAMLSGQPVALAYGLEALPRSTTHVPPMIGAANSTVHLGASTDRHELAGNRTGRRIFSRKSIRGQRDDNTRFPERHR